MKLITYNPKCTAQKENAETKRKFYAPSFAFYDKSGYTLIEMMVSVAIFTMVAIVSISTLVSINDANKKAQTMRAIIDNLNFAIENMARNLRVGSSYHCDFTSTPIQSPRDCAAFGSDSIVFESYDGSPSNPNDQVVFRLETEASVNRGQIVKSSSSGSAGSFLPITPFNPSAPVQPLTVNYLKFYVTGTGAGDGLQPKVVIIVGGTARYNNQIQSVFNIQTSVSQRKLDS